MKAFLSAGLAACLLTATAPAATAHPRYDYYGGCSFYTVSDQSDSPSTRWLGVADAVVVATYDEPQTPARTAPVTVACEIWIDGGYVSTPVVASGTGYAAGHAVPFELTADPDSIVSLCEIVTVGGETHDCRPRPLEPLLPWWVYEFLTAALDYALTPVDDVVCAELGAQDGGPADQPPLDIRPGGDLYVGGEWFWDCAPYGV